MASVHHLNQPVVLDFGSGLTKAGYAGTSHPSVLVGSLVGTPKFPQVLPTTSSTASTTAPTATAPAPSAAPNATSAKLPLSAQIPPPPPDLAVSSSAQSYIVGDRLHSLSGVVSLHHPLHRGAVTDWPAAEHLLRHVIVHALSVAPPEHPFLLTEALLNPRRNRDRLAQFFFEDLDVPALHVAPPPVLALYASGRTTGLVVDAGDTVTSVLPVMHGHCDPHTARRLDLGGRDITDRLATLLRRAGASLFASSSERQAVRRLKERLAFVAADPAAEERRAASADVNLRISDKKDDGESLAQIFELPDGNLVNVAAERFRAPEILFRPDIVGVETGGVAHAVADCLAAVDLDMRRPLYSSILLAGGTSKLRGFAPRLLTEVRDGAPPECKVRIHSPPDRLFSAYTGGSILASLSTTFRSLAVSRAEYFEYGASFLMRKTL